jgi:Cation transport protein
VASRSVWKLSHQNLTALQISGASLSGSFRKLSKVVLIAVMIRGRHRGLPMAIDRAVLLPRDIERHDSTRADVQGDGDACITSSYTRGGTESRAPRVSVGGKGKTGCTEVEEKADDEKNETDEGQVRKHGPDDRHLSAGSDEAARLGDVFPPTRSNSMGQAASDVIDAQRDLCICRERGDGQEELKDEDRQRTPFEPEKKEL